MSSLLFLLVAVSVTVPAVHWLTAQFCLGQFSKVTNRTAASSCTFGAVQVGIRNAIPVRLVVREDGVEMLPGLVGRFFMPFDGASVRVVHPFGALRFSKKGLEDAEFHATARTKRALLRALARFQRRTERSKIRLTGQPFR